MNIYLDKLAHVQVVINCWYSVAQMCTGEDTLANNLGTPYFDDLMSYYLCDGVARWYALIPFLTKGSWFDKL